MRGFVCTPPPVVDRMVHSLFAAGAPGEGDLILDPGAGEGAFIAGLQRWATRQDRPMPPVVGVELDPQRCRVLRKSFRGVASVRIEHRDFLSSDPRRFRYIIGNPPYVPITALSEQEKAGFRARYSVARGRFDLYLLFFEQALRQLAPGGRLVFITPEKFLYVATAAPLRRLLAGLHVEEIALVEETTFGELVTYPTITTVDNRPANGPTSFRLREGGTIRATIPADGSSLLPRLRPAEVAGSGATHLSDVAIRISAGVATGADKVFVRRERDLSSDLARFGWPTISGRELDPKSDSIRYTHQCGYDYVAIVPMHVDNVDEPFVDRDNDLGIDVDAEYAQLLDTVCRAYRARWHF